MDFAEGVVGLGVESKETTRVGATRYPRVGSTSRSRRRPLRRWCDSTYCVGLFFHRARTSQTCISYKPNASKSLGNSFPFPSVDNKPSRHCLGDAQVLGARANTKEIERKQTDNRAGLDAHMHPPSRGARIRTLRLTRGLVKLPFSDLHTRRHSTRARHAVKISSRYFYFIL